MWLEGAEMPRLAARRGTVRKGVQCVWHATGIQPECKLARMNSKRMAGKFILWGEYGI
mgnify:CR=1 FL=1